VSAAAVRDSTAADETPHAHRLDRGLRVLFASRLMRWRDVLLIVKPNMLLRWHRQGFRLFWRHTSHVKPRPPRIAPKVIALIHTMSLDNRLWGTKRIHNELCKRGFPLAKRTVARYIRHVRPTRLPRKPMQPWGTFLNNHAHEIWACDFLHAYALWFRSLLVFFILAWVPVVSCLSLSHPPQLTFGLPSRFAKPRRSTRVRAS